MSNIAFVYVPSSDDKCQKFAQLRLQHIKESASYSDSDYITMILNRISTIFNTSTLTQRKSLCDKSEEDITDHIKRQLQNDEDFCYTEGFIVNTEARNQSSIVGYYDLKFENSYWLDNYFVLECKKIDGSDARSKEYIHKKTSSLEDGGMYRFIINKYAENKPCGGMLGYVVKDSPTKVVEGLKDKITIHTLTHNGLVCGNTIDNEFLSTKVDGFDYSFQSNHTRVNNDIIIDPIHLLHIFWDLTS